MANQPDNTKMVSEMNVEEVCYLEPARFSFRKISGSKQLVVPLDWGVHTTPGQGRVSVMRSRNERLLVSIDHKDAILAQAHSQYQEEEGPYLDVVFF